jgi:hypothetical protein
MQERIWYEDLGGWFTAENYYVILPMDNMSMAEKLNALTRFFVYMGALLAMLTLNYRYVFFGIAACLLSALLFQFEKGKQASAEKFLDNNNLAVMDRKLCSRPTLDNPFMNPNLAEEARPEACSSEHPGVADTVKSTFNTRYFKDVNDIWGRNSSQRQFYTVPSTMLGGDQAGFAKWLYATGPTCKEGHGPTCESRLPNVL